MTKNCIHLKRYHIDCSINPVLFKEHLCTCCISLGITTRSKHHVVRCSTCQKYILIFFFTKLGYINGYIDLDKGISCDKPNSVNY